MLTDPLGHIWASGDKVPFYLRGWILGKRDFLCCFENRLNRGVACAKGAIVTNAPKNPLGRPKSGFLAPLGQFSPLIP